MSTGPRRWLAPLLAALAVLAVVAVMWQQRPGAAGGDAAGGDAAGDSGAAAGGDAGQGGPPYSGSEPRTIAVSSFYRYDATHLAINYTNGVPACYGRAGVPRVEESADAVVVTIPRIPATQSGDRACIDIALMDSADVTLASPLDGRKVLDGARDGARVEEAAAPFSSDQAK